MNAAVPSGAVHGAMRGKVCVVTGATSGIGRETAVGLAALGADVWLVGRDAARGEAAVAAARAQNGGGEAVFLKADFSLQREVRRLADEVHARCPRVDVLVNNAGGVCPERRLTADGVEQTFAVNHLAPFLLTDLLRDRLSDTARVVTVSSDAHRMLKTLDFDNLQGEKRYKPLLAYAVSKLANVLFTYELARRFQGSARTATCLHPGVVRTGIWAESRGLFGLVVTLAKPFMLSSEKSARSVVRLAADPTLAATSGRYFNREKEVRSSEISYDANLAARLWQASEALIR